MPKKSKRHDKTKANGLSKENDETLINVGVKNFKNWVFLKDKLNFKNDSDFVEYLLSVAEKYLCSKLIQYGDKRQKQPEEFEESYKQPEEESKVLSAHNSNIQKIVSSEKIVHEIEVQVTEELEQAESEIVKTVDFETEHISEGVKCDNTKKIKKKKNKHNEAKEKKSREAAKQKLLDEISDLNELDDDLESKIEDKFPARTLSLSGICRYCDLRHTEDGCPLRSPLYEIPDSIIISETNELSGDDYAKATLPNILELREEGGTLGVFTVASIAQYSRLGPLVGTNIKEMEIADDYSMKHIWEVSYGYYLSTSSPEKSNWLRWIRPAPSRSERNVVPIEMDSQLYFVTLIDIPQDAELLYWAEMTGSWASKKMEKTSCGGCNLQFDHAMYYRLHCAVFHEASLSLTVRKYHCKVCGKAVLGKQNIMKHALLYHDGKGAYQCQFCSKFFLRLNYLEMHRNYGCSANPHRARPLCDYCGRKFCQPQKLKVHIKRMHSDLSEVLREFQCADCLKVLGSRAALQRHTKEVHKRPSGVSCVRCSKTFQNKSNLKIHMLTHSGVKPFKCQEERCAAAFTTKQCLQFHYKKVHGLTEDRYPRIVRSVEYTFESYAGEKDLQDDDSNREDSLSSEASTSKHLDNDQEEQIQEEINEVEVQELPQIIQPEPTCEETSVIEYHTSVVSKASKKWMGDSIQEEFQEVDSKLYRRPESSNASLLVEAALDAAEKDIRPDSVEMLPTSPRSPPIIYGRTSPLPIGYMSPRYDRQYLSPPPPHEFVHEEPRYREDDIAQNLTKYKYDEDLSGGREIYHSFIPRYTMYDYSPDVIRAMNMQTVDLSMPRGQLLPPVVSHIEAERMVSPTYQPFSQTYIPQKSPTYHHYSGYY